ncbi:unnamed protein product [Onchocerca flexuosa]|uniref:Uncharacterized protein n=1 Tax=Onchocerca flexuosa TaxID=387005 RepID=A0A183HGM0_9BILA|nr:unnamed protein product [Onchocerca flexuosa]
MKPSTKAELLTDGSISSTGKSISHEDEQKRSKESFFFPTKKQQLSKEIDSDSKIQQIDHPTSSFMMKKTAAPSPKPISPPIIYPPTPPRSPRTKKKRKRIPDSPQKGKLATAILPDGNLYHNFYFAIIMKFFDSRIYFGMSSSSDESDSSMEDEDIMWRSVSEASPNAFISHQQISKSKESSELFGIIQSFDKNNDDKSFSIPTASNISDQSDQSVTTGSHYPDKPPLTAKKLKALSLLKGRQYRFGELPKKFLDVRSAEISSPKISSTTDSTPSVTKEEATDLKVSSADVLVKPKKKNLYVVSENEKKRKFGLLPPTPSLLSISSQRSSKSRSKEIVALKTAISKVFLITFFITFNFITIEILMTSSK